MIQPGEIWIADIRYTDGVSSKKRPVLVLWLDGVDVVVAVVTTAQPRTETDVVISDWQNAGLRAPSTVRLSRLDCLEQTLLLRRLGMLSANDRQLIRTVWDAHVKPQF